MSHTEPFSYDRERALNLAKSGDYKDWVAICRKMQFEGWGIEIFDDVMFTEDLDLACSIWRASRARQSTPVSTSTGT